MNTQPTKFKFHFDVINLLIGLCVAMYVITWFFPSLQNQLLFWPPVAYLQPWRFLTAAFLHSGFMHLAFNMSFLYILGQLGRQIMSQLQLGLMFFLCAWGGSVGTLVWARLTGDMVLTVGASGAVMGLCAGLFVCVKHIKEISTQLGVLLAINLVIGFIIPNVAWHAHLGGAAVGLLLGLAYRYVSVYAARRGNEISYSQGQNAAYKTWKLLLLSGTLVSSAVMAVLLGALTWLCYQ